MLGFRVWDVENKCFVDLEYDAKHSDWSFSMDYLGSIGHEECNYIAMQSTGIHDCSGKLIYENDIIQVNLRLPCFTDKIFRMFVGDVTEFLSQAGEWDAALQHDSDEYFEDIIIVCGNTYENPELLEKIK